MRKRPFLFGHADRDFYVQLAGYYVGYAVVEVMEYAKTEYGCSLARSPGKVRHYIANCSTQGPESAWLPKP